MPITGYFKLAIFFGVHRQIRVQVVVYHVPVSKTVILQMMLSALRRFSVSINDYQATVSMHGPCMHQNVRGGKIMRKQLINVLMIYPS